MALIQSISSVNAKLYDVRSYLNIHQFRPLFTHGEHTRLAQQSCVFRGYEREYDGLDSQIQRRCPSVQRLLNLYVFSSNTKVGSRVSYEFKRLTVHRGDSALNLSHVLLPSVHDTGLLVLNRQNLVGGMSIIKDIKKELPPGYMLILDNTNNAHQFTEIAYVQTPDQDDVGTLDLCVMHSSTPDSTKG